MLGMTIQDMRRSDILEMADEKHAHHRTFQSKYSGTQSLGHGLGIFCAGNTGRH